MMLGLPGDVTGGRYGQGEPLRSVRVTGSFDPRDVFAVKQLPCPMSRPAPELEPPLNAVMRQLDAECGITDPELMGVPVPEDAAPPAPRISRTALAFAIIALGWFVSLYFAFT